jgi:aspartyl-tRNA(Asn)/glutamyl-tRNA(Gln) amidotransferase subunit A
MDLLELVDSPGRRGEVSVRESTSLFLSHIDERSATTHAVLTTCADLAYADADRADAARSAGSPLPLDGMPLVLKDNIDVAGVRCTCGSKFFSDRYADRDATVVRLLRAAGGVVLGKSQTTEFMFALAAHPIYEPCRNVWDPDRIPGASSSGSGCAVADDQAIGGLGTDTGGSVRIPAAFSGITGLRPTFGLISSQGVFPLSRSLDAVGPMARSALDVTSLFEVLCAFDPQDNRSVPFQPVGDVPVDLPGLRIGVPRQFFFEHCDPEIEQRVRDAIETFRQRSATIVEVDLPLAEVAHRGFTLLIRAEALAVHEQRFADRRDDFSVDVRDRLSLGEQLSGVDVAHLIEDMHAFKRQLGLLFAEHVDVIMTPTTQCIPPLVTDAKFGKLPDVTRLTYPWSFGHVPAISVPCGFTDAGLPVGLQIIGRPHADRTLLDIARQYQTITDWHRARPGSSIVPTYT